MYQGWPTAQDLLRRTTSGALVGWLSALSLVTSNQSEQSIQLLYAKDWCEDGHGIHLVFWFGDEVAKHKRLHRLGRGIVSQRTREQLREVLASASRAAQDGKVEVFILDISRTSTH